MLALLRRMLVKNPEHRISLAEVFEHSWVQAAVEGTDDATAKALHSGPSEAELQVHKDPCCESLK